MGVEPRGSLWIESIQSPSGGWVSIMDPDGIKPAFPTEGCTLEPGPGGIPGPVRMFTSSCTYSRREGGGHSNPGSCRRQAQREAHIGSLHGWRWEDVVVKCKVYKVPLGLPWASRQAVTLDLSLFLLNPLWG